MHQLKVGLQNTVAVVISVMVRHPTSADVLKNACGVLQNLANGSAEYKIAVAKAGGITAAITALQDCASSVVCVLDDLDSLEMWH